MQWTNQQALALNAVASWLKDPTANQVFRLFGYAGTGKTTLAKHLADSISGLVLYATFTGKAALVLRKKGCEGAKTIHSLIYKAELDEETGHVSFMLDMDSDVCSADLIVIDEVSMVDQWLGNDLLSFGKKVLVLGDPEQLPPISGEGFFVNCGPDFMLTDIRRQEADNPIILLSMHAREGKRLQVGNYGDTRVVARKSIDKMELREIVMGADQILCGLNDTRKTYNARVRQLKGLVGLHEVWHPAKSDKLVCLKNKKKQGLFNGGIWQVESEYAAGDSIGMDLSNVDEPNMPDASVVVHQNFFNGTEKDLDWNVLRNFEQFTYGYCLTVHKSQGSQWDNVALVDESRSFREHSSKHLYTGITRAAEKLTIVI